MTFAVELHNLDLNNVDGKYIVDLVANNRVVVIRNKNPVAPEQLVNLYKKIGTVVPQRLSSAIDNHPELCRVRSDGMFHGDEHHGLSWHNAKMNTNNTDDMVAMYMVEPSKEGGETYFSDSQTAYDDLADNVKDDFENLVMVNKKWDMDDWDDSFFRVVYRSKDDLKGHKDASNEVIFIQQTEKQPLITKHPVNGRKGINAPLGVFKGVDESSPPHLKRNQEGVISYIEHHVTKKKYVYKHKWMLYDIVINDQWHGLHKRTPYSGSRELWRTAIMY